MMTPERWLWMISIACIASAPGPLCAQIPVLIYHAHPNFGYDEAVFTSQMDFLADNGYHTLSLDQFFQWHKNAEPLPLRPIVLTVDDNYIRIYTSMYPIWNARGQKGVNFAHTNYVGVPGANDHADWFEINEMEASGTVATESHTVTHRNLTTLSAAERFEEIVNSKTAIEANITSKTCLYIAYPYGAYDAAVTADCEAAGYRLGFTTINGLNYRTTPPFELRRISADGISLETFIDRIGYHHLPPPPPGKGWILDNADPHCFYDEADWSTATTPADFFHTDFLVRAPESAPAVVRWAAYLPVSGPMNVYARWTADSGRAPDAVYTITHTAGQAQVIVDQRVGGGVWNLLGAFLFAPGRPVEVTLGGPAGGSLAADAVWFEPIAPTSPSGWQIY
ncbi:MAG: hypothetical protein Kow0059_08050 [Candidatus Sumerlaeia bacterium]